MRVTVIPEDKWIRKDDVSAHLPEWNFNDPDIHAIQWYEDHGEIEWKNPQRNESITDDSILQPYITALDEYIVVMINQSNTNNSGLSTSTDNTTLEHLLNS